MSVRLIVTGADTGGLECKLQIGVHWQGAGCRGVFLSEDWLQGYLSSMPHTCAVSLAREGTAFEVLQGSWEARLRPKSSEPSETRKVLYECCVFVVSLLRSGRC